MTPESKNPYVGLRPFESDESILFFGRNEQTLELLQRLHKYNFVAVVGSSGCGKSSLLRAGLLPALKAGYLVDDSDEWLVAIMKPGHSPLYNLAKSILELTKPGCSTNDFINLKQQVLEGGADVLLQLIQPIINKDQNVFLLVDQFEELFRFSMEQNDNNKKDEAIDFVNIMLELAQQKEVPIYVVMTMRSDFIGDCAKFYGLPEAMNKSQYLVPRLNRMQMKTVIEGPARLYGGKLNPSLTSLLLNETGKVKDELPLLQHALMRMWDFEIKEDKSGEINFKDFESIGGLEKALSNHADEALKGMSESDLNITKEMFQALTAIDENGRKIRRPVLLSQLKELTGATEEILLNIIQKFIEDSRCFLIKNDTGETGEMIIDISHESLIRQWKTLSDWVDEEDDYASVYLQVAEAYRLKTMNKKDYLSGTELDIALDWYQKFKPTATWANRYKKGYTDVVAYLKESEKIRDEHEKERLDNEAKEAARLQLEAEQKKEEKRQRIKRQIITSAFVTLGVIIFLVWFSVNSKRKEIDALVAKEIATTAEQKTKELLQLVVSGRGKEYSNQEYAAVVDGLRKEQSYPLEQIITPNAIRVPITGTRNFDYLIWLEVPSFRRDEIKEVMYKWPCSGFVDNIHIGKEASVGFAFGYRGWDHCPQILIQVKLVNGEIINIDFDLEGYLQNNNSI